METPKTLPLTIRGETREVEVKQIWPDSRTVDTVRAVALFQKRPGGKLWAGDVRFWWDDKIAGYRANLTGTFLNRAGYRAVAWNDPELGHRSEHNSLGQG